jgi:hypothetical protein
VSHGSSIPMSVFETAVSAQLSLFPRAPDRPYRQRV